ncbi:MAG: oligopeptide ABC transporter substrate-binding protein [Lactobacillales bacterium]|jgi:peptide/nickel transport system substrate-binding protein|nr:oligopeptide ABC transporter substrate-binding protein [Lactobacillales bacterium]
MKSKRILGLIGLATISVVALAACGSNNAGKKNSGTETEDASKFPLTTADKSKAKQGGTLNVAVVMDTQFQGMFEWEMYQDAYDASFMAISHEGLFKTDETFKIVDGGAADLKLDKEKKTATVTLKDNVKWNDGETVNSDDLLYPYLIIGAKDSPSTRYDDNFSNIVGMDDYHSGKAKEISGITKDNDKQITIQFNEVDPGMLQAGGAIWGYAAPYHQLKDIPIADLASSDAVRKNPLSFGPYYMNSIVKGESVEYLPNKYYHGSKPKLDKIIAKGVPSDSIVEAMKAKKYDLVQSMPTDTYDTYKDTEGYSMLGGWDTAYSYLGFKLGKFDKEAEKNVTDKNAKMANKSLRQAMAYALDWDSIGNKFYSGLRTRANSAIIPAFGDLHASDSEVPGYKLDLDKAKKLLDDAGYKDTDKDGFREDPKGNKLEINFASMAGGDTAQPIADYEIQQWKKIGLNVKLTTGRLIDFQAFYDKIQNDDPSVDVYAAAWGTGTDPSPTSIYGPNTAWNYTRFVSDENTKLLKNIDSNKSFDDKYRKEAFNAWQKYASEEAFFVPTQFRYAVVPVSDKVVGYSIANDVYTPYANIGLAE